MPSLIVPIHEGVFVSLQVLEDQGVAQAVAPRPHRQAADAVMVRRRGLKIRLTIPAHLLPKARGADQEPSAVALAVADGPLLPLQHVPEPLSEVQHEPVVGAMK